jgi:hypothetical protein
LPEAKGTGDILIRNSQYYKTIIRKVSQNRKFASPDCEARRMETEADRMVVSPNMI